MYQWAVVLNSIRVVEVALLVATGSVLRCRALGVLFDIPLVANVDQIKGGVVIFVNI